MTMRTEPMYRLRRIQSGSDAYGDPIYTRARTQIASGMFAPYGMAEPIEPGRTPVVSEPAVYWRREWPDLVASDQLEVRGKVYDIIGDPADWKGTRVGGLHVKLKRAEEGAA